MSIPASSKVTAVYMSYAVDLRDSLAALLHLLEVMGAYALGGAGVAAPGTVRAGLLRSGLLRSRAGHVVLLKVVSRLHDGSPRISLHASRGTRPAHYAAAHGG